MKKGDYVETPRFCKVKIEKVYRSRDLMLKDGYSEPTHYRDPEFVVNGRMIGVNRMQFAAIKRANL